MSMKEQMETGKVFIEFGHASEEDQAYEKLLDERRRRSKSLCFQYNQTDPMNEEQRGKLIRELLGGAGKTPWLETPIHFAYGCNTTVGDHFYSNFNLTVVDDVSVTIGNCVMCAPNVTISTTGHPVHPYYRTRGAHFSLPIVIEDNVWIGANVAIMPCVTIGTNSVLGAGREVPRDIPANVVAFGTPCRVIRPITDEDLETIRPGATINEDWNW